jgi:hypothetical protein
MRVTFGIARNAAPVFRPWSLFLTTPPLSHCTAIILSFAQQPRQLGKIHRDSPRLIAREKLRTISRTSAAASSMSAKTRFSFLAMYFWRPGNADVFIFRNFYRRCEDTASCWPADFKMFAQAQSNHPIRWFSHGIFVLRPYFLRHQLV